MKNFRTICYKPRKCKQTCTFQSVLPSACLVVAKSIPGLSVSLPRVHPGLCHSDGAQWVVLGPEPTSGSVLRARLQHLDHVLKLFLRLSSTLLQKMSDSCTWPSWLRWSL